MSGQFSVCGVRMSALGSHFIEEDGMKEGKGLDQLLQATTLNRRHLLKRAALIGVSAPLFGSLLAACGEDDDEPEAPVDEPDDDDDDEPDVDDDTDEEVDEPDDDTDEEPVDEADEADRFGGTLRVAIIGEPPAFDPTFTTATVTSNTTWHVFESLFYRDEEFAPQPMLLSSFDVDDEGVEFTFYLREDVAFHNGDIMDADDVIASLERYATLSGRGRTLWERVDNVEKIDDLTVSLTCSEPTGIMPVYLSMTDAMVIPAEAAEGSPDDELADTIGTGPYMLGERLADRYTSLVRFDDYAALEGSPDGYGGRKVAYFDEIRFIPVPEISVRADGLITDEFDYSEQISTDQFASLEAEPDVNIQITLPYYFTCAHFNKSEESIMSSHDLRMAFLTAMNAEPAARAAFGDEQFFRLSPAINAPETAWHTTAGEENYSINDPDRARELLEEAGYDGTPIRWITTQEYGYMYNTALVYSEQLEAVGVEVDLQVMDWATLVATRSQRDAWDIFVTGHPTFNHPVLQVFLDETWPGWWDSEQKDELISGIMGEPDPDVQMEYIEELQQLIYDDASFMMTCEYAEFRAYRNRLAGYQEPADWFFWNAWFEE